jgi:protein TonB
MPSATLRLVHSREPEAVPDAAVFAGPRPAPETIVAGDGPFRVSALASFGVHAAILAGMIVGGIVLGEERSAGSGEDVVFIESVPVELVDSAPTPEAPPVEAAEAEQPLPEESAEATQEPVEQTAALEPAETPPEPTPEPPPAEPVPTVEPTTAPLPPADAPAGELPAEPEVEAIAPDAETMPIPRTKPQRIEVAEAEPPPEPKASEPEPKPAAAPPPSAPSAPASTESGGAGAGGSSATAGASAASAYRAKVAAQLKRKRFYPNAARRDRLTGTATVSFTLNASGKVMAVKVVRSSGARVLDEAAREMVQRASPYPPIPAGLGPTITIQAPIAFDLPR